MVVSRRIISKVVFDVRPVFVVWSSLTSLVRQVFECFWGGRSFCLKMGLPRRHPLPPNSWCSLPAVMSGPKVPASVCRSPQLASLRLCPLCFMLTMTSPRGLPALKSEMRPSVQQGGTKWNQGQNQVNGYDRLGCNPLQCNAEPSGTKAWFQPEPSQLV